MTRMGLLLCLLGNYRVQIGHRFPHHSHHLMSIRGVIFCHECGAYGVKKCTLLATQCEKQCSTSSQRARDRLLKGLLPTKLMKWPRMQSVGLCSMYVSHTCSGTSEHNLGSGPSDNCPAHSVGPEPTVSGPLQSVVAVAQECLPLSEGLPKPSSSASACQRLQSIAPDASCGPPDRQHCFPASSGVHLSGGEQGHRMDVAASSHNYCSTSDVRSHFDDPEYGILTDSDV